MISKEQSTYATMTPFLIAAREGIIWWVTLCLIPVEIVFDAIEGELDRQSP
jgi:hypothetical protein